MKGKHILVFIPSIIGIFILSLWVMLKIESISYYERCLETIEITGISCADYIPPVSILFGILLLFFTYIVQCVLFKRTNIITVKIAKIWSIFYLFIIIICLAFTI